MLHLPGNFVPEDLGNEELQVSNKARSEEDDVCLQVIAVREFEAVFRVANW
jgi:hypothetical protein